MLSNIRLCLRATAQCVLLFQYWQQMPTIFEFYVVTRSYSSHLFLCTFALSWTIDLWRSGQLKLRPKECYVKRKVICHQLHVLRIHIIGGHWPLTSNTVYPQYCMAINSSVHSVVHTSSLSAWWRLEYSVETSAKLLSQLKLVTDNPSFMQESTKKLPKEYYVFNNMYTDQAAMHSSYTPRVLHTQW